MNKLANITMQKLRKQNKKFATIINKPVKPRKKKGNDNKEAIEVNIAVYYVIFWLIIAYLSFNTLF